jgi:hypothetical protein
MLAGFSTGCVTRRYMITSDPPGAIVYRDGQPIGATPVVQPFLYYGKYRFRLVKDGKQPLDVEVELCPPWYQWPGVDFVAENLIPYPFRDVQTFHFPLQDIEAVRHDDVRNRAEWLRQRGKEIQPPPGIQEPPPRPAPAPRPGGLPPPVPVPPVSAAPAVAPSPGSP